MQHDTDKGRFLTGKQILVAVLAPAGRERPRTATAPTDAILLAGVAMAGARRSGRDALALGAAAVDGPEAVVVGGGRQRARAAGLVVGGARRPREERHFLCGARGICVGALRRRHVRFVQLQLLAVDVRAEAEVACYDEEDEGDNAGSDCAGASGGARRSIGVSCASRDSGFGDDGAGSVGSCYRIGLRFSGSQWARGCRLNRCGYGCATCCIAADC